MISFENGDGFNTVYQTFPKEFAIDSRVVKSLFEVLSAQKSLKGNQWKSQMCYKPCE